VDEQKRGRVLDDLKGFVKGELLFDDITRTLYSTDASIFQVRPAGVVVPRDEEDVQALVRYAAENSVPLIARGAGTGVAGEALGSGIILDLSRHFRSINEIGSDTVRVQPGVTYRELNARLAAVGRRFAPDPASGAVCTVGGMLANNASGAHVLRFGYTRDHVQRLRIVLDSGDAVTVGKQPLHGHGNGQTGHLHDIVSALGYLLEENADLIRTRRPRTCYNRCGYILHDTLADGHLELPRLLVGSEGTLALFTEATLKTVPLPGGRALVLLGFAGLDTALQAVSRALPTQPSACELIDRRLLSLARGADAGHVSALIPPAVEAVLLVEYEADTPAEARRAADGLADTLRHTDHLPVHAVPAHDPAEIDRLWNLREIALPGLYGLKGGAQPVPFVEDVAVPIEELGPYLRRVQDILQEHEITASFLVHAGSGQAHTRPFLDLQRPEDVSRLLTIAEKVHTLAIDLGGTVSTQHGTGLARTPWVARQYGPLYAVFRQVKAIFDPKGLFNPGKIVDPDPTLARWPLRTTLPLTADLPVTEAATPETETATRWQLRWDEGEVRRECLHCNGCGQCRTEAPAQRMCPIFRSSQAEAATPRAKANLLRHLLEQAQDGRAFAADEVRAVADLCVNCKMCAHECPARVNIPKLMLEAKAANVAEHGMTRSDWFLARTEGLARWASALAVVSNLLLASRSTRWLLEKFFGLCKARRLPRFAFRSFFSLARRRGWMRKPASGRPCVAYFADVFASYNDPQLALAVVAVLKHQGIDVYVPPGQRGSGAAALAYGDVDAARDIALGNLRVLADLAREGFAIVCSEPTAALMLRQDYLDLVLDADARLVADNTVELTSYLAELHRQGKLRTDFAPLPASVGHHVPCHLKALGQPPAALELLSLIPELHVHEIDVSCSGMAGTFGLNKDNYETSLAAGRPMLAELERLNVASAATECSACRMQIEHGGRKRTLHPVQYLALAYGLMPELAQRLREPFRELVL
jgi:FAD/FMN-containing dehydrogenase/Fe-S oxidoreductase